jgi:CYTH domain-containing protein/GNAT superfamily N-acetyltransferase
VVDDKRCIAIVAWPLPFVTWHLKKMSKEIERKFLVIGDGWKAGAHHERFRQGYLLAQPGRTVRVRVAGQHAWLTVKGMRAGLARDEYEYEIPVADADHMLDALCEKPLIEKTRYFVPYANELWEVDEFAGDNAGLVVAEVELEDARQAVALPPWVGQEVTDDPRYYNANLVRLPFRLWHIDYAPLTAADRVGVGVGGSDGWLNDFLRQQWGSELMVSRGRLFRPAELEGFVARQGAADAGKVGLVGKVSSAGVVGLVTYSIEGDSCEIQTLDSLRAGVGIGSRLIELVKAVAVARGCKRLWLVTTNDNTHALRFYQRRGFVLAALHRDAIQVSRRLKPQIPLLGNDAIPLHDEIELEVKL